MLTIVITDSVMETARKEKKFPVTVGLRRLFPFAKLIRSNQVCAVIRFEYTSWLKIKLPPRMWDWGMTFREGGKPGETVLNFLLTPTGEESIMVDTTVKDFRDAEMVKVPVTEAA